MTLKILFLPFVVVISLAISIFYIKPEIDNVLSKRDTLNQKNIQLADAQEKNQHINALVQDLDRNKENEDAVLRYLPNSQKDDQLVALLQYEAAQASVSLNSVLLEKVVDESVAEVVDSTAKGSSVIFATDSNDASAIQLPPEKPRLINAKVEFVGSYESIRGFVQKVAKSDSFQDITLVEIKRNTDTSVAAPEAPADPNILKASVHVTFSYLAKKKTQNMVQMPIFSQDALSYETVNNLRQFITSPVPAIQTGSSGKANPFLP